MSSTRTATVRSKARRICSSISAARSASWFRSESSCRRRARPEGPWGSAGVGHGLTPSGYMRPGRLDPQGMRPDHIHTRAGETSHHPRRCGRSARGPGPGAGARGRRSWPGRASPGAGPSPIRIGPVLVARGGQAVAPPDQRGVERDHVEEGPEAQLLAEQPAGQPELGGGEFGVEEQLARVVARLPVDVDGPGVVGGLGVVEPERIGEPGVGLGEGDDLAGPGVVEPDLAAGPRPRGAGRRRARPPGGRGPGRGRRGRGRGRGRAGGRRPRRPGWSSGSKTSPNGPGRTASRPARRRIRLGRTGRETSQWPYSLTTQTRAPVARAWSSSGAQASSSSPDEPGEVGAGGAEPLGVVVEVREVDERQVGPLVAEDARGAPGDPGGAGEPGGRAPEGVERELAQLGFEPVGQALGRPGDPERLVAVGRVIGLGGDAEVDRRPLVEPPEQLGRP